MNNYNFETSEELMKECINDLYLHPKKDSIKWSKITNQTPQGKFAYPSQHIASLITGVKGLGSAARGDDLADGTEVKSCSRADQLNRCKECNTTVLSWQDECSNCGSKNITQDTSSHWIFTVKEQSELDLITEKMPRLIFILFDKEDLSMENIRIRAWAVNPKEKHVKDFFTDYFVNNYQKKMAKGETPSPCNLHPLKYDFLMMKPKLIFHAEILEEDISILFWDIENPKEQPMPSILLKMDELEKVFEDKISGLTKKKVVELYPLIEQEDLGKLVIREKRTKSYKNKYARR